MDLKTYLSSLNSEVAQKRFAKRCGSSLGHFRNVICGTRKCGEGLAIEIEKHSSGAVPCESMRPDVDWVYLRGTSKQSNNGGGSERKAAPG